MDLKSGKVLVTGGSKGIGRQIAQQLVQAGASVVISARNPEALKQTAAEIDAGFVVGDISDESSVKEIVDSAYKQLGGLNAVVNNAAFGYFAPIQEIDSEKFEQLFRTNVTGSMLVARECSKHFIKQSYGNIVNISSTAGGSGFAGGSAYAASKFALKGMTECWRAELRKHNVRVMLVNPSEVQTDFGGRPGRETGKKNPTKLFAEDIATTVVALLGLNDRAFVTETSVWATNPQNA